MKYVQLCTMILSSPIRIFHFSLENLTRIKGKKRRFFTVCTIHSLNFIVVSKLKCTVVKRSNDGLSCKFTSFYREIGFPEKVIDRGIYLPHGIASF